MKTLKLLDGYIRPPVETGPALERDTKCRRCKLKYTSKRCLPAEHVSRDASKTLIAYFAQPAAEDVRTQRPWASGYGGRIRKLLDKHWCADYVLDNTVRCLPEDPEFDDAVATACSVYTRHVVRDVEPDRILAFGEAAGKALLGYRIPAIDARRNYNWVVLPSGKHVPVFVLLSPAQAAANSHLERWLDEDVDWACNVSLGSLEPLPVDAEFHIVETLDDAREAAAILTEQDWVAYDTETAGKHFSEFFTVPCISVSPAEGDTAFVWGRATEYKPDVRAPVLELLQNTGVGKVGHNEKYDSLTMRATYDIRVQPHTLDTQLTRHLVFPGCNAKLEVCSDLVGMGGYKQGFAKVLAVAKARVRNARKKSKGGKQLLLLRDDPILEAALADYTEDVEAFAYGLVKSPDLERYNAFDSITTARLARGPDGFKAVARRSRNRHIWKSIVCNATESIEQIEAWGIPASRSGIENFREFVGNQVVEVRSRFDAYGINPDSPVQVANLLFKRLGLKNPRRPQDRSTDKKALKSMASLHPVVNDLREYRRVSKLLSGYGNLDKRVRPDGRIHPSFRIDGTECMPAGELVLTEYGYRRVEDVRVGDNVLTHVGRWKPVVRTSEHAPSAIWRVTTCNGLRLRTTANHEYLTQRGWVSAEHLRSSDCVREMPYTATELVRRALSKEHAFSWVPLARIELDGHEVTYGLTVADDHSHVTGGIVTHNTGRLSCVDPSLHTIPRGEDTSGNTEGQLLKQCFAAAPGRHIRQYDYSQLEYRIAALLSGDKVMAQQFHGGADFHMSTARLIAPIYWGIHPDECNKTHRSATKNFNFGLLYGMQDSTIAEMMKCSREDAAMLRAAVMGKFVDLDAWIRERIRYTKKYGITHTYWEGQIARTRQMYQIGNKLTDSKSAGARITAQNGSYNTSVQGSASDFMLASINRIVPMLLRSDIDAKLCLTVHDSVIFDCLDEHGARLDQEVMNIMSDYDTKDVPIVVDGEWGPSWGDLRKVG